MRLVNLTPHPLTLRDAKGVDHVIEPSGTVARVATIPGDCYVMAGIPVPVANPDRMGEVTGLPAPEEGVSYIVSGFVGAAIRHRHDILVPGTGPKDGAIRNEKGHIVAVTRLKWV